MVKNNYLVLCKNWKQLDSKYCKICSTFETATNIYFNLVGLIVFSNHKFKDDCTLAMVGYLKLYNVQYIFNFTEAGTRARRSLNSKLTFS